MTYTRTYPPKTDKQLENERICYGMTVEEALKDSDSYLNGWPSASIQMLVMSTLSDSQELIFLGEGDKARQHINLAKLFLKTYFTPES